MTKLDRALPRSISTTRPTEQAERTSGPQATQNVAAPDVEASVTGKTDFAQLAAALATLQPQARHVAQSADPRALWGGAPNAQNEGQNLRARFASASPAERTAIIAQVHAQRAQCEGKIAERSDKLEKRWRRMNGGKRQEILKQYIDKGGTQPAVKAEIIAANKQSAAMQAEIDALAAKLKATYPAKTPAEDKERRALKKELVELRVHQREVLNAATDTLAATGQKLELLATNETNIDPKGHITKGEDSLLSMIGAWLGFNSSLTFFDTFLLQNKISLEEQRKQIEAETLAKTIQEGDMRKKNQLKGDIAQRDALRLLAERIDGVRKG